MSAKQVHRLVTIRFSHYNELARWALDHAKIAYKEDVYLPLFSTYGVIKAGGLSGKADRASTKFSTPLLVCADGTKLHDSRDIVRFADKHLPVGAPPLCTPASMELVERFHDHVGPNARRLAYYHIFSAGPVGDEAFLRSCEDNVGPWQGWLFRKIFPTVKQFIIKGLGISKPRADKSHAALMAEFDFVAETLGKSGADYLTGEHFSAADIAFAALAAPILCVTPIEGYAGALPCVDELPESFRVVQREFRAHPAGAFALRMFRLHRGDRQIPGEPPLPMPPPCETLTGGDDEGTSSTTPHHKRPKGKTLGPGVATSGVKIE